MSALPTILDPCCGSRMFWFDPKNQGVLFGDIRDEEHMLCDGRVLNVKPDVNVDFRAMPFADESFRLVVFDPPHLRKAGETRIDAGQSLNWQGSGYRHDPPSSTDEDVGEERRRHLYLGRSAGIIG
ncbi:hypothetical protein JYK21_29540 [Ralstonia pickettii]|nr:hypothetical protein [Ralstonia pickettii]